MQGVGSAVRDYLENGYSMLVPTSFDTAAFFGHDGSSSWNKGLARGFSMEIPDDRYYSEHHLWVKLEDGLATIGITEHAREEMGGHRLHRAPR